MILTKPIPKELTYKVRHVVLRKGKPIETCYFEGDDLDSTTHFGLFIAGNLTAVVSVYQKNNPNFKASNQLQVRGMAVLPEYQQSGLGRILMKTVEEFAIVSKIEILWFNARETALHFYKNSGYEVLNEAFEIENIGTHYLMFKKLA